MRQRTKTWLIIAFFLVLIGCIIGVGVMSVLKWDFTKLSTTKYESKDYEIREDYQHISLLTSTADILFVPSDGPTTRVSCYEHSGNIHSVSVKDGTLEIKIEDTRKWYEYIGINFSTPKITVYIPQGEYGNLITKASTGDIVIPKEFNFQSVDISLSTGDVALNTSASELIKIRTSTGDICMENINAGSLDLTVSTGKITVSQVNCKEDITIGTSTGKVQLSDIRCKNVITTGSTGDISLSNVIAAETLSIKRNTGKVTFTGSDAAEIHIETSTGDVKGSLLTDKVFITQTDTGSVDVPKTAVGGKCEISTDTGDIKITIE